MHQATVAVLLIVSIYIKHKAKLLNGGAQVDRLLFVNSAKLKSDEVGRTIHPVHVERIVGFVSGEGFGIKS